MFASALLALPKSVIKLPKTILQYAIRAAKVLPPGLIYLSYSSILYYCAIVLCVIFLSLFGPTQPVCFIAHCIFTFSAVQSRKLVHGPILNGQAFDECLTALYVCFPGSYQDPYGQLCIWRKCTVMCFTVGCVRCRATFQGRLGFMLVDVEAVFYHQYKAHLHRVKHKKNMISNTLG